MGACHRLAGAMQKYDGVLGKSPTRYGKLPLFRWNRFADSMKLLYDFFPILLFFIAYKLYGIYAATVVAIVASFFQVGGYWLKHRRFENMHLITLGLIVVLGGATLWLQDERFIKWKPTLVNWLFGIAFLGSHFIGKKPLVERMMSSAVQLPGEIWGRLNLLWVVFFMLMGVANLYVVYNFDTDTWVNFKLFGMMGLTFAFVIGQAFYLARHMQPDEETGNDH
jgi:intracellular septation protein